MNGESAAVDANGARERARVFLASVPELQLCDGAPIGLYNGNASKYFYFFVHRPDEFRIGGTECVSVCKATGSVRSEGRIGD